MAEDYTITELPVALEARQYPSVTVWNRLEGQPRRHNFTRALKAEIPDALFMLTKQWQMGEFRGDDAGSPATVKVQIDTTKLRTYQPAQGATQPFDDSLPLEARVERRPIQLEMAGRPMSLDLRLLMGRQWLKMLASVADYESAFIGHYKIEMPNPARKEDAHLCAHPEVWQMYAAVAGKRMDGGALYAYLVGGANRHAWDGVPGILAIHRNPIDDVAVAFVKWYDALFTQPAPDNDAWLPDRLEYQFACSAPEPVGETVVEADEYFHGHLDWYNLDVAHRPMAPAASSTMPAGDPRASSVQSMIPSPITYDGMPNTRWWEFEDRRVNFGAVSMSTTDIGTLMFLEFGLVFANDWYLIPVVLPAGSLARVKGMAVTTVFGERFWIDAAGSGAANQWQRWSLFTLSPAAREQGGGEAADTSLLLLPTVPKVQEGKPLDAVALVRDEVANMVWGVEKTVPLATGIGKSGSESAAETLAYFRRLLDEWLRTHPSPATTEPIVAPVRYQLMNTVPEHWIPFIPVRVPGDNRAIQLQRAALLRTLENDPADPEKVRPRTALMRPGLDSTPKERYYVHEEEVTRAGTTVRQAFQRTRWRDGRVVVWLGARKQTGRGEASSALSFDQLVPVPQKP